MAVVSVRRALQVVDVGLRVPGAPFARAYSVFQIFPLYLGGAALVRATRHGRHSSRARRTLPTASTRPC